VFGSPLILHSSVSNDLDILLSKEDLVCSKRAAVMRNAGPGCC
jgi:hypothetical protein